MENKIQAFRNIIRPILTLQISTAYIGLVFCGYFRYDIALTEAMGLLGTYFGSIMTYHFLKSSKIDIESKPNGM